ncbi:N-acetylglutamate synthase [Methylophaga frappieri]|uniref:Amino-acid acetyltransferase n=1 Tax=Methylophaga frappieri (strain ATCC BAA-2434 / DSM 25690 / JAM7) TaxID=754477 RepID=I1YJ06_METFJ|nr:amino-acid N-acetyltransferase [Methylophaga frappieri]AFJ02899.1 N-acetylglutamate synthase [Methylophaga frappieri]
MTSKNDQLSGQDMIRWFRAAAPYIHAHGGATFVIAFDGESIAGPEFDHLIHDLAILNSLEIRLVLIFGARPQIEQRCHALQVPVHYHHCLRITDDASMQIARQVIGDLRIAIEAKLSAGLPQTPMADARIRCVSGNWVTARPAGIIDGIDLGHTGEVRRIDSVAIHQQLEQGNVVLLSPLGYSLTGEIFNLSAEAIATAVATSLQADKLIFIGQRDAALPREITLDQITDYQHPMLAAAQTACLGGVERVHLLDRLIDGALLQELFSRDGVGTLISAHSFESIRQATIDDVGGILELLHPLEANGVLVKRSRELLEREIEKFTVMERDGSVVACAALYPYPESQVAELACLAVSDSYRRRGRGKQLLAVLEQRARQQGLQALYVLTTQTAHWFIEHGFQRSDIADLPVEKQALYNYQRNSSVFRKSLN